MDGSVVCSACLKTRVVSRHDFSLVAPAGCLPPHTLFNRRNSRGSKSISRTILSRSYNGSSSNSVVRKDTRTTTT